MVAICPANREHILHNVECNISGGDGVGEFAPLEGQKSRKPKEASIYIDLPTQMSNLLLGRAKNHSARPLKRHDRITHTKLCQYVRPSFWLLVQLAYCCQPIACKHFHRILLCQLGPQRRELGVLRITFTWPTFVEQLKPYKSYK